MSHPRVFGDFRSPASSRLSYFPIFIYSWSTACLPRKCAKSLKAPVPPKRGLYALTHVTMGLKVARSQATSSHWDWNPRCRFSKESYLGTRGTVFSEVFQASQAAPLRDYSGITLIKGGKHHMVPALYVGAATEERVYELGTRPDRVLRVVEHPRLSCWRAVMLVLWARLGNAPPYNKKMSVTFF